MIKASIEFKNRDQVHSPSQENVGSHILSGNWICRGTGIRCGQILGSTMFAGGVYLLNLWSDDGQRLLVALSAISALAYISLAMQSRTGIMALLNLLAVPILFTTAYAGMGVATEWVIVSFILHGCITMVQVASVDKNLRDVLFCRAAFNSSMAVFLLLAA